MPADVSGVVAFRASDDAAFITRQTIVADGGSTRRHDRIVLGRWSPR
jgi:3-oxoacyl-[acyl-carrier protein] reductase/(S)-1-phenylethanol dehydrogenase